MKLFNNKTARRAFIFLTVASLLIFSSLLFITLQMHKLVLHRGGAVAQISQIVRMAERNHGQELLLQRGGVRAWTTKKPIKGAKQLHNTTRRTAVVQILSHRHFRRVSVKLANDKWLNLIFAQPPRAHWVLFFGYLITALVLICLLLVIYYSLLRRITLPITELQEIAGKSAGSIDYLQPLQLTSNLELNKLIAAFNLVQARVQKLLHSRTQMLAAISHDLRTPITRLKLRAEYLEDSPQYEKILADIAELEEMIKAVIAFTRTDAYSEPLEKFDLEALLESICNDMTDAGLDVAFAGTNGALPYDGRVNALKRAFGNLINNAIKYGEQARVNLGIMNNKIVVEIIDQGPGIPEVALEKVFEPFYRVDDSRSKKTGGTGLGLVIARDIIRAHQGEIKLQNVTEGGLRVVVELPLQ